MSNMTDIILEGATFEEFIWHNVELWVGEGGSVKPETEIPSYITETIAKAEAEFKRLTSLSDNAWYCEWAIYYEKTTKANEESEAAKAKSCDLFMKMWDRLETWNTESQLLESFKNQLRNRIKESIDHLQIKHGTETILKFDEWKIESLKQALDSIKYYSDLRVKALEKLLKNNEWKEKLMATVPMPMRYNPPSPYVKPAD